jgi:hypothetical protein
VSPLARLSFQRPSPDSSGLCEDVTPPFFPQPGKPHGQSAIFAYFATGRTLWGSPAQDAIPAGFVRGQNRLGVCYHDWGEKGGECCE